MSPLAVTKPFLNRFRPNECERIEMSSSVVNSKQTLHNDIGDGGGDEDRHDGDEPDDADDLIQVLTQLRQLRRDIQPNVAQLSIWGPR